MPETVKHEMLTRILVGSLLLVFIGQLSVTIVRDSATWDEGDHIYSGFRSLEHGDFGLNPEHPPLVKALAAVPLLPMRLNVPEPQNIYYVAAAFLGGKSLLFESGNDAEAILARARIATGSLAVLLAILLFLAGREMFGIWAGVLALAIWVFEPLAIAHGARVTTDTGCTLFFFATTYAFYRYVKTPSILRLILVGLAAGLTLATKHSGLLILPTLGILAFAELIRQWPSRDEKPIFHSSFKLLSALILTSFLAVTLLWASYGFRFAARPDGLSMNPSFSEQIAGLGTVDTFLLSTAKGWHLLPESYIFGLAAVRHASEDYHSYLFGTIYPTHVWYYFPAAFVIKTTLGLLGLIVLSVFALALRKVPNPREVTFLLIPATFYFLIAITGGMNIGIRHLMPVYAFLTVFVAGATLNLIRSNARWAYAVGALLILHIGSSIAAFPNYMAYANEAWGGPSQTYRYLTDSSVDWAQQLKSVKRYCDERNIKDGWFAYFGQGVLVPGYYGIPLKPLPTADSPFFGEEIPAPTAIEGIVFISAGVLAGWEYGPEPLDPYAQFRDVKPVDVIDDSVFVFQGRFEIPLAAALWKAQSSAAMIANGHPKDAFAEAQQAVALAPNSVQTQTALGDALSALGHKDEARSAYLRALELAKTIQPEFQKGFVSILETKLSGS